MWQYRKPRFEPLLLAELQRQQRSSMHCDTVLQGDGISVPVHSCILSAFCPQLSCILSSAPALPRGQRHLVEVQAVHARTLIKLVSFLYSGELQGEGEQERQEVISAAFRLGIDGLIEESGDKRRAQDGQQKDVGPLKESERRNGEAQKPQEKSTEFSTRKELGVQTEILGSGQGVVSRGECEKDNLEGQGGCMLLIKRDIETQTELTKKSVGIDNEAQTSSVMLTDALNSPIVYSTVIQHSTVPQYFDANKQALHPAMYIPFQHQHPNSGIARDCDGEVTLMSSGSPMLKTGVENIGERSDDISAWCKDGKVAVQSLSLPVTGQSYKPDSVPSVQATAGQSSVAVISSESETATRVTSAEVEPLKANLDSAKITHGNFNGMTVGGAVPVLVNCEGINTNSEPLMVPLIVPNPFIPPSHILLVNSPNKGNSISPEPPALLPKSKAGVSGEKDALPLSAPVYVLPSTDSAYPLSSVSNQTREMLPVQLTSLQLDVQPQTECQTDFSKIGAPETEEQIGVDKDDMGEFNRFKGNIPAFINYFLNPASLSENAGQRWQDSDKLSTNGKRNNYTGKNCKNDSVLFDTSVSGPCERVESSKRTRPFGQNCSGGQRNNLRGRGGGVVGSRTNSRNVLRIRQCPLKIKFRRQPRGKIWEIVDGKDEVYMSTAERRSGRLRGRGSLSKTAEVRRPRGRPVKCSARSRHPFKAKSLKSDCQSFLCQTPLRPICSSPVQTINSPAKDVHHTLPLPAVQPPEESVEQFEKLLEDVMQGLDFLPHDLGGAMGILCEGHHSNIRRCCYPHNINSTSIKDSEVVDDSVLTPCQCPHNAMLQNMEETVNVASVNCSSESSVTDINPNASLHYATANSTIPSVSFCGLQDPLLGTYCRTISHQCRYSASFIDHVPVERTDKVSVKSRCGSTVSIDSFVASNPNMNGPCTRTGEINDVLDHFFQSFASDGEVEDVAEENAKKEPEPLPKWLAPYPVVLQYPLSSLTETKSVEGSSVLDKRRNPSCSNLVKKQIFSRRSQRSVDACELEQLFQNRNVEAKVGKVVTKRKGRKVKAGRGMPVLSSHFSFSSNTDGQTKEEYLNQRFVHPKKKSSGTWNRNKAKCMKNTPASLSNATSVVSKIDEMENILGSKPANIETEKVREAGPERYKPHKSRTKQVITAEDINSIGSRPKKRRGRKRKNEHSEEAQIVIRKPRQAETQDDVMVETNNPHVQLYYNSNKSFQRELAAKDNSTQSHGQDKGNVQVKLCEISNLQVNQNGEKIVEKEGINDCISTVRQEEPYADKWDTDQRQNYLTKSMNSLSIDTLCQDVVRQQATLEETDKVSTSEMCGVQLNERSAEEKQSISQLPTLHSGHQDFQETPQHNSMSPDNDGVPNEGGKATDIRPVKAHVDKLCETLLTPTYRTAPQTRPKAPCWSTESQVEEDEEEEELDVVGSSTPVVVLTDSVRDWLESVITSEESEKEDTNEEDVGEVDVIGLDTE